MLYTFYMYINAATRRAASTTYYTRGDQKELRRILRRAHSQTFRVLSMGGGGGAWCWKWLRVQNMPVWVCCTIENWSKPRLTTIAWHSSYICGAKQSESIFLELKLYVYTLENYSHCMYIISSDDSLMYLLLAHIRNVGGGVSPRLYKMGATTQQLSRYWRNSIYIA